MPTHRHGPGWNAGEGPSWWPEGEQWPPRSGPGHESFEHVGRRLFKAFLFVAFIIFVVAGGVGAAIATALAGVAPDIRWSTVGLTLLAIIVAGRVLRTIVRQTWSPVRSLVNAAGQLADGDYTVRVDTRRAGTIQEIGSSFNSMAAQLEHSDEQRRRLMADLGHELRTPLAVIRGEIEAVMDGVRPGGPEQLASLLDEVEVLERLIDDLRLITLSDAGRLPLQTERESVVGLIEELANSYQSTAADQGVEIVLDVPDEPVEVDLDAVRIRQALSNLVVNALRAMTEGGTLRLGLIATAQRVEIEISDSGSGISPDQLPEVFDRFTKSDDSPGSGLGLSIARGIIRSHGGDLEIVSTGPTGTTVSVWLPLR